jgi:hypothetical protein
VSCVRTRRIDSLLVRLVEASTPKNRMSKPNHEMAIGKDGGGEVDVGRDLKLKLAVRNTESS